METAIILAAGLGTRLRPLTEEEPKCMTDVGGKPLLLRTLEMLEKSGFKRAVIVIGHLSDKIIKKIGSKLGNLSISYIKNEIYDKTNSMYSLWLAREHLAKGALVIEGDCTFENRVFDAVLNQENRSVWAVGKFVRGMEGSMSKTDSAKKILEIRIVRKELEDYKPNYFKSAGLLKVDPELGKKFAGWLDAEVKEGNTNIYYDLVLSKHIQEHPIYVCDIGELKWIEIDTLEDLEKAEKMFTSTKFVIIILDGAADLKIKELGDKTPFEYAKIPTINFLAREGRTGLLQTSFKGMPVGSIVANLSILGYNPLRYYPNGRASFEALAQGIYLDDHDVAFRCNLISLKDGKLSDFTADWISDANALQIIDALSPGNGIELYCGQSYRNILVRRNANFKASDIISFEPHMNLGKPLQDMLLKGTTPESKPATEQLNKFMLESQKQIARINLKLKTKADMTWLWSPSSPPQLPSFFIKTGLHGAVVAGLDFMRGIATSANMQTKEIRGATGMLETNLKEKLKYAINFLRNNDLVYVHVNAPDEESHRKSIKTKIQAIENIENEIVKPLLDYLNKTYPDNFRLAILPDHYTLLKDGTHFDRAVPFLMYGSGIKKDEILSFSETEIEKYRGHSPLSGYEFMRAFTSQ